VKRKIDKSSHKPYYLQLKEIIESKIKNDVFPDGKMWSESEISKKYGLTITTIRKSLFMLKQEKKIYSVRGVGYFVNKPKIGFDLTKYLSLGRAIKEQGINEKIEVLSKEDNFKVEFLQDYGIKSNDKKSIKITRLRYIDKIPIDYEEIHLNKKICGNILKEPFDSVIYNLIVDKLKINIRSLEEYLEAGVPTSLEAKLLNLKNNMPVLIIYRVIKDNKGNWIEITKCKIRSDMFRYHIKKE